MPPVRECEPMGESWIGTIAAAGASRRSRAPTPTWARRGPNVASIGAVVISSTGPALAGSLASRRSNASVSGSVASTTAANRGPASSSGP